MFTSQYWPTSNQTILHIMREQVNLPSVYNKIRNIALSEKLVAGENVHHFSPKKHFLKIEIEMYIFFAGKLICRGKPDSESASRLACRLCVICM